MTKVINSGTTAETPLADLQDALTNLPPGKKIVCPNTKEQILTAQRNLTRQRAEIPGADSHLEYIEALLLAEARGKLEFQG